MRCLFSKKDEFLSAIPCRWRSKRGGDIEATPAANKQGEAVAGGDAARPVRRAAERGCRRGGVLLLLVGGGHIHSDPRAHERLPR